MGISKMELNGRMKSSMLLLNGDFMAYFYHRTLMNSYICEVSKMIWLTVGDLERLHRGNAISKTYHAEHMRSNRSISNG